MLLQNLKLKINQNTGFFQIIGYCLLSACGSSSALREEAKVIEKKIATARERGAYNCAAEEYAAAEANLEFLRYELDEGDYRRAEWHKQRALESVSRAIEVTDPNKCADPAEDKCPDEPEDVDGFQDKDGCPDPDNDGDTVLDVNDKCPMEAGDPANKGCPIQDRDKDGVADALDKCPDIPEDRDGFEDDDGCPEDNDKDTDGDGILDPNDMCPLEPGPGYNKGCPVIDRDHDGIVDEVDQCPDVPGMAPTGCPKRILVVKTDKQIEIKEQIKFAFNKALIQGALSFEILDQVAAVMISNPDIKVVIEGHTDNVASAEYNLKLSDARANAVRNALIERTIEASRMEAIGYGESRPLASNKSSKGRAANRRVEFHIVDQEKRLPANLMNP